MPPSIRDQALEWHQRLRDDTSLGTRRDFEQWRSDNPAHAAEYDQQALLSEHIALLGWRPSAAPVVLRRPRWVAVGAGAATALAASIAGLVYFASPGGHIAPVTPIPPVAETWFGPTKPTMLPDGTIVLLAGYSRLDAPFDPGTRHVGLIGTAARFFVAGNIAQPLTVEAGGMRILSSGGVFDVDLEPGAPRVTAIRGALRIANPQTARGATVLVPALHVLVSDAASPREAPSSATDRATMIDADNLLLSDLLRLTNSLPGPAIVLGDPALGSRRLVGRFDVRDHRALARKLALAFDLRLLEQNGRILLATH